MREFGATSATQFWRHDTCTTDNGPTALAPIVRTVPAQRKFDPGPRDEAMGPNMIVATLAWQAMAGWAASCELAGTLPDQVDRSKMFGPTDPF